MAKYFFSRTFLALGALSGLKPKRYYTVIDFKSYAEQEGLKIIHEGSCINQELLFEGTPTIFVATKKKRKI